MSASTLLERCRGISAVSITPFVADGFSVDVDGVEETADFLVGEEIDVVVACGNTGEFYGLSDGEARTVAEATVRAVAGRAPVVVGVGGSPAGAARAAAHAAEIGADGVMVHHPAHPFVTAAGFLAYLREIGAAGLPLIPYLKSPGLAPDEVVRVAAEPAVVALKYAVNDLQAFGRTVAEAEGRAEVTWICGTAERWAPFFFALGAEGFTSGLVNVTAAPSRALLHVLRTGERAAVREAWQAILPFEELRARRSDGYNVAVVKEAVRQLGRPAGPVRPPSSEVGERERKEITEVLRSFGLVAATL